MLYKVDIRTLKGTNQIYFNVQELRELWTAISRHIEQSAIDFYEIKITEVVT